MFIAGEYKTVFGIVTGAFYTGKAKVGIAAVKVFINYIENVGPPVTVHMLITVFSVFRIKPNVM